MSVSRNYYGILRVDQTATQKQIKQAYYKTLRQLHPDKSKDEQATEMTKDAVQAYGVLSDIKKRRAYDLSMDLRPMEAAGVDDREKPDASSSDEESAPVASAGPFSSEKSKFTPRKNPPRDPQAPLELGFDLETFKSTLRVLVIANDIAEATSYLNENLQNLESTVKNAHAIQGIITYLNWRDGAFPLIECLRVEWLKGFEHFHRLDFIGQCLNTLWVKHWQLFLDHLGRDWLCGILTGHNLYQLLGNLTGDDSISGSRQEQRQAIFTYFTRAGLRDIFKYPVCLAEFLANSNYFDSHSDLLTFLDGEDHWIQNTITAGSGLGYILNKMAQYILDHRPMFSSEPAPQPQLCPDTVEKWQLFLRYFEPACLNKMWGNYTELSDLFETLDMGVDSVTLGGKNKTKKIELFRREILGKRIEQLLLPRVQDGGLSLVPASEEKKADAPDSAAEPTEDRSSVSCAIVIPQQPNQKVSPTPAMLNYIQVVQSQVLSILESEITRLNGIKEDKIANNKLIACESLRVCLNASIHSVTPQTRPEELQGTLSAAIQNHLDRQVIQQRRGNSLVGFFKGLLKVLLTAPLVFAPLLLDCYHTLFAPTSVKKAKKMQTILREVIPTKTMRAT